ncbi:LPXTG cell wall anchor domain-containing protein [Streptomyces sp. CBMA123]|uniref:LPXTG cell wall anchor domain-containing protein n=1 Tax=Streptomyces sp. CBMA123 TaxID=1896313 RepID=UPI001661E559|nr:LPXTG cell wall anchor domain-containing protein [Streptomyces sp. CBMA123]
MGRASSTPRGSDRLPARPAARAIGRTHNGIGGLGGSRRTIENHGFRPPPRHADPCHGPANTGHPRSLRSVRRGRAGRPRPPRIPAGRTISPQPGDRIVARDQPDQSPSAPYFGQTSLASRFPLEEFCAPHVVRGRLPVQWPTGDPLPPRRLVPACRTDGAASDGRKLATTGSDGTLLYAGVGTALLVAGAGAVVYTRRRRTSS